MSQFRSKPKIVEAEQFLPGEKPLPFRDRRACFFTGDYWYVVTAHGQETIINPGDWIIAEPDGSGFYPCKPNIFRESYELVEQEKP